MRLKGEIELMELVSRKGYRCAQLKPSEQAQFQRRGEMVDTRPYEADVQVAVLRALTLHPLVAWCYRMNVGGVERANADGTLRFIRFGWPGMLDITGQLVDGRRLEVECKRIGEKATPDQQATIDRVNKAHGLAFVAHCVDDVYAAIPLRKEVAE
jgi:hypothetical protein